ncbi:MAG: hypothetical protein SAK29_21715 [Scytonema sp. PMC 1069.18]|nr:hypothetical protein [Scytonema sp. PMC 1069.18]MEC4881660.1 hypothetical protein [Scytonema sp. PMC 1070.18]
MHSASKGFESVAEMIARLVCDYEARQAVSPFREVKSQKSTVKSRNHQNKFRGL